MNPLLPHNTFVRNLSFFFFESWPLRFESNTGDTTFEFTNKIVNFFVINDGGREMVSILKYSDLIMSQCCIKTVMTSWRHKQVHFVVERIVQSAENKDVRFYPSMQFDIKKKKKDAGVFEIWISGSMSYIVHRYGKRRTQSEPPKLRKAINEEKLSTDNI